MFAAVSSSTGGRYIFFQDTSGDLREGYFSQDTREWTIGISSVIPYTSDARNNTPIAAMIDEVIVGEVTILASLIHAEIRLLIISRVTKRIDNSILYCEKQYDCSAYIYRWDMARWTSIPILRQSKQYHYCFRLDLAFSFN